VTILQTWQNIVCKHLVVRFYCYQNIYFVQATPIVVTEQENSEVAPEAVVTPSKVKGLLDSDLPALLKVTSLFQVETN
jgi:hypothetical protein